MFAVFNSTTVKRTQLLIPALLLILAIGSFTLMPREYVVDVANASITYDFPVEGVKGSIEGLSAQIIFNPNDLGASSISGSVDVSTIETGIKARNSHLQAKGFFHANEHPELLFQSTAIRTIGSNGYEMDGMLTMKGISKPVTWAFRFENNVFQGVTTLYTSDFEVYGKSHEDSEVTVTVNLPVNQ